MVKVTALFSYHKKRSPGLDIQPLKTFGRNLQTMFLGHGVKLRVLNSNHQQPNNMSDL